MAAKTIVGGRTFVTVDGTVVGVFDSCTINEGLTLEDIHILGKYGADEIVVTSYNAVTVSCTGFRIYGNGVKVLPKFPTVNDLLLLGTVTLSVQDRQNLKGNPIATVINAVPETNSENFNARATSKINISYRGTLLVDETTPNDGENGATSLP
jgi:hypothetical protein